MASDANNVQERNKLERRIAKAARRIKRGRNVEAETTRMLRLIARLNVINGHTLADIWDRSYNPRITPLTED